jgi:hypothetical protein
VLIVSACRLFAEVCESALRWEETARFVAVDAAFRPVRDLYVGAVGLIIDEAARVPAFLSGFGEDTEPGEYRLMIDLDLPPGWAENVTAALENACDAMIAELRS